MIDFSSIKSWEWLVSYKQSNVIKSQVCERKSESKFVSMQEFMENSAAHVVSMIKCIHFRVLKN